MGLDEVLPVSAEHGRGLWELMSAVVSRFPEGASPEVEVEGEIRIAVLGRPNVGKSTLFNRLTRTRDAIVADVPGLTRDRHYGRGRIGYKSYIVVDTGGLEPVSHEGVMHVMAQQTLLAIDEADAVVLMVDGRQGLTAQDRAIAEQLRKTGRKIWLVVNKAEGMQPATVNADFHELALGDPLAISAVRPSPNEIGGLGSPL